MPLCVARRLDARDRERLEVAGLHLGTAKRRGEDDMDGSRDVAAEREAESKALHVFGLSEFDREARDGNRPFSYQRRLPAFAAFISNHAIAHASSLPQPA